MKSTAVGRVFQATWLLLFIAACFGIILLSPLSGFYNMSYDWPKEWLSYRVLMMSLNSYGEFPWFSYGTRPYYLPCYYTFFNPENGYFSLTSVFLVAFNHFFKAVWFSLGIHLAIGGFAFYHLMTRLGCERLSTLLFLTAFLFGSWPLSHFSAGHLTWQTWYLFPLCIDLLLRGIEACRSRQPYLRFLVATACVHAFMLYEGGQHIWLMSGVALGLLPLLALGLNPGLRVAVGFTGLQALAIAAFAAPKLLPVMMLFPAFSSAHDYPIEVTELFDAFLNLSYENWEKDFFFGFPASAVLLVLALLWLLRRRLPIQAAQSQSPKGLGVEDRKALSLLILIFALFAFWPWREWFDAVPGLRAQGVRARFLGFAIFFALMMGCRSCTLWVEAISRDHARRIGVRLALVVLIGLNIWSLREKVVQTHAKVWVPIEEFHPVPAPMGKPMIRAFDSQGESVAAVVQMKGPVDFEVVWPEQSSTEGAVLIFPRLPYELYRKAFESPGAKAVSRNGKLVFTKLQSGSGRIPFHYTMRNEKVGALAFVILAGLLPVMYRLNRISGVPEARQSD